MKLILKKIKKFGPFHLSMVMTLLMIAIYFMTPAFLEIMELKALDYRMVKRGALKPGPEIVIIAIDEKSLDEVGRWPWPRSVIADVVDKLTRAGAKVIGFDMVFSEPQTSADILKLRELKARLNALPIPAALRSELQKELYNIILPTDDSKGATQRMIEIGRKMLRARIPGEIRSEAMRILVEARRTVDNDVILAEAIRNSGRVVLGYFFHFSEEEVSHIKDQNKFDKWLENIRFSKYRGIRSAGDIDLRRVVLKSAYAVESNIDMISKATDGSGYFNFNPDPDGTVRRIAMIIKYRNMVGREEKQDMLFPPLAVKVLEKYLDNNFIIEVDEAGVRSLRIKNMEIPTTEYGEMLINFDGAQGTFPYISASDVLFDRAPQERIKDKIALIGPTATGILDLRVTPFDPAFPGVEVHANIIDNILHQRFIYRPNWLAIFDIIMMLFVGVLVGLVLTKIGALGGALAAIGLGAAYAGINYYIFSDKGIWLNIVYPLLTLALCYSGTTVYHYMAEEREKKKIKGAFQYYVTEAVVDEMLKDPSKLKLGGEKRELTVLFSDIRGFTSISEHMDPEELVKFLNEYLTAMTDIVFEYKGTLDKYMGDAIMAIYGAPLPQPDHAERACYTALAMIQELGSLRKKWEDKGLPKLNIGVGISSGPMVVGNMGSLRRFDYTAMGDSVNLGSRLEGLNKEYGSNIIISEETYKIAKGAIICRELDSVRVKGKDLPVRIYELIGAQTVPAGMAEIIPLFEKALELYRSRQFDEAILLFRKVLEIKPNDGPSKLFIKRCEEMRIYPPPSDWDGVYTMTTK